MGEYKIELQGASPDKVHAIITLVHRDGNGDVCGQGLKCSLQEKRRETGYGQGLEEVSTMMKRAQRRAETWVEEKQEAQRLQKEYNASS